MNTLTILSILSSTLTLALGVSLIGLLRSRRLQKKRIISFDFKVPSPPMSLELSRRVAATHGRLQRQIDNEARATTRRTRRHAAELRCAHEIRKTAELEASILRTELDALKATYCADDDGAASPCLAKNKNWAVVKAVYNTGRGRVAGCFVDSGEIRETDVLIVVREGAKVFEGPIMRLRGFKDGMKVVRENFECGIMLAGFKGLEKGDVLVVSEDAREKLAKVTRTEQWDVTTCTTRDGNTLEWDTIAKKA